MGKVFESIDDKLRAFIQQQQMFFVATAPCEEDGLVNLSPKGLDAFRVLGPTTVAYADIVGSGIETVAHLKQNGRIVIMFCAFDGPPKIVRLHGRGEVIEPGHADYNNLQQTFPSITGLRCFIRIECTRVSDSCGYGVPIYEFKQQRNTLTDWAKKKGVKAVQQYVQQKNATSLDGLPGLASESNSDTTESNSDTTESNSDTTDSPSDTTEPPSSDNDKAIR